MSTISEASQLAKILRWWPAAALVLLALAVSGCTANGGTTAGAAPAATVATPAAPVVGDAIKPLSDYATPELSPLPTPTPTGEAKQYITIATQNTRANLRTGPGTNFDVVIKANPNESYELVGKSADGKWFQVVLPPSVANRVIVTATTGVTGSTTISGAVQSAGAAGGAISPTAGSNVQTAWVSSDLVNPGGSAANVPTAGAKAVLPADLQAEWKVDWSCNSQGNRCEVKTCAADVKAAVNRPLTGDYLPVEHTVTWANDCFKTDAWTFDVNQADGKERTGEVNQNFLYGYWLGANPGAASGVFPLDDKTGVQVYCSGPHKVEVEEGGGWTSVYEGNICNDVKTGMLVYMNYIKRWFFTGANEGKTYDHAYFGDSEKLEQRLTSTNAELATLLKK